MIGGNLPSVGCATGTPTHWISPRRFIRKYAKMVSDACGTILEHARYRLYISPYSVGTVHNDRKTLGMKVSAILSDRGPDLPKILASNFINSCSDSNVKKALHMCVRYLNEGSVPPFSKINAMQLLVVVALSSEYNAYRVATSGTLKAVYRLAIISSERDCHLSFDASASKAQLIECSTYAHNVLDILSNAESFDIELQRRMPFGLKYLLSKCHKIKKQYMDTRTATLYSGNNLHDHASPSAQKRSTTDILEQTNSNPCHTKMKELEYRVSLVEDEMRELGIGRELAPKSECNDGDDDQGSEVRVVELVSTLYYLKETTDTLMTDVMGSEDFSLYMSLQSLLGRIETLESECRSNYMEKSTGDDMNPLQITLNELKRADEEEFHTSRESMNISHIVSLSKGDIMSTCTYKSARSEVTARETFCSEPSILDETDEQTPQVDVSMCDHKGDENILLPHKDVNPDTLFQQKITKMPSISLTTDKCNPLDANDVKFGSSNQTMNDHWAELSDVYECKTGICSVYHSKKVDPEENSEQETMDTSDPIIIHNTQQSHIESQSSKWLDLERSISYQDLEQTSDMERRDLGLELPESESMKTDNTDSVISSAMNVLDMLRNYIRGYPNELNSAKLVDTMSDQALHSISSTHVSVDSTLSRIKADQSGDGNKYSKWTLMNNASKLSDTSVSCDSYSDGINEEFGIAGDALEQQSRVYKFSNMSDIRQIIIYGTSQIYRNDNVKVIFRHQLLCEGTGKVVDCHLTLTNLGNKTIEQVQFDFLNFENFPIHLVLSPMADDASVIRPTGSMHVCFRLYPLTPFIGIPKIKLATKGPSTEYHMNYTLYLPISISSFLVPEPLGDIKTIEELQKQSKVYFLIRNTADFEKTVTLASLGDRLSQFKLDNEPDSVFLMASLYQSLYENAKNECYSKFNVLIKLEPTTEPTSFSIFVYSKSDRLAEAVAQLYKYLFHNQGDVYGV